MPVTTVLRGFGYSSRVGVTTRLRLASGHQIEGEQGREIFKLSDMRKGHLNEDDDLAIAQIFEVMDRA